MNVCMVYIQRNSRACLVGFAVIDAQILSHGCSFHLNTASFWNHSSCICWSSSCAHRVKLFIAFEASYIMTKNVRRFTLLVSFCHSCAQALRCMMIIMSWQLAYPVLHQCWCIVSTNRCFTLSANFCLKGMVHSPSENQAAPVNRSHPVQSRQCNAQSGCLWWLVFFSQKAHGAHI